MTTTRDFKSTIEILKLKLKTGAISELEKRRIITVTGSCLLLDNSGTRAQRVRLARALSSHTQMTGSILVLDLLADAIEKDISPAEALFHIMKILEEKDLKQKIEIREAVKAFDSSVTEAPPSAAPASPTPNPEKGQAGD